MLVGTFLYNPAPRNPSKFTNHLIAKAMNFLLHLQVESKFQRLCHSEPLAKNLCSTPLVVFVSEKKPARLGIWFRP